MRWASRDKRDATTVKLNAADPAPRPGGCEEARRDPRRLENNREWLGRSSTFLPMTQAGGPVHAGDQPPGVPKTGPAHIIQAVKATLKPWEPNSSMGAFHCAGHANHGSRCDHQRDMAKRYFPDNPRGTSIILRGRAIGPLGGTSTGRSPEGTGAANHPCRGCRRDIQNVALGCRWNPPIYATTRQYPCRHRNSRHQRERGATAVQAMRTHSIRFPGNHLGTVETCAITSMAGPPNRGYS